MTASPSMKSPRPSATPTYEMEASVAVAEPKAVSAKRRSPVRTIVFVVVLVAGGWWGVRTVQRMMTHVETDNAYVTGHVHLVSPRVSGVVSEVRVEENSLVKEGDVLVRLDPRDAESRVAQASAQVAHAEAQVGQSRSQITDARAKVAQAEAQFEKADADFHRVKDLADKKVASKQELDAASAAYDSSKAAVDAARATGDSSEAALRMAEAGKQTDQAVLDDAKLQLSYTVVKAPSSGRVGRRNVEVGNHVQPGQPIFAVVEPNVWIEANFKETQLARMHAGQAVEVTIDAIPNEDFTGTVESFSPASGAQFAMLPPDNATGNFTKVVQRVPVRIHLDPGSIKNFQDRLRPGLSAIVAVRLN